MICETCTHFVRGYICVCTWRPPQATIDALRALLPSPTAARALTNGYPGEVGECSQFEGRQ